MITVGMNYEILEGKEGTFERAFNRVLEIMKSMSGHTASHLYRDVNHPRSYLIVSAWTDRTAFESFIRSEQFAKVTNWGKENILASRPRHEIYEHEGGRLGRGEPA
ncbi:MAG: antibiotic biosynthesis monooxygenase [Candidatus Tectomicrobia bacterium]|nr:antibiotic biosynthesis monooxygenase [Candidatus Tectomicrobia bacterium]